MNSIMQVSIRNNALGTKKCCNTGNSWQNSGDGSEIQTTKIFWAPIAAGIKKTGVGHFTQWTEYKKTFCAVVAAFADSCIKTST